MKVFVTGATGFIGSEIVRELLGAGHQVLGLTRSDAGAQALQAAGAAVHRGNLEDLDSLCAGAQQADAVIHTAFDHDFSNFVGNCEKDKRAIEALGTSLLGSPRPLLITSGVGMGSAGPGQLAIETQVDLSHPNPRVASELAGSSLSARGVDVRVVRLPQVHNTLKQGLITYLIALAREQRLSAYAGEGLNRWSAVHVRAAAHLYRLVLERGVAGRRYHAVAETGVTFRAIAEAIGQGLKIPVVSVPAEKVGEHFGWLQMFAGLDLSASSELTRQWLDWEPTGPSLLTDLEQMRYDAA